ERHIHRPKPITIITEHQHRDSDEKADEITQRHEDVKDRSLEEASLQNQCTQIAVHPRAFNPATKPLKQVKTGIKRRAVSAIGNKETLETRGHFLPADDGQHGSSHDRAARYERGNHNHPCQSINHSETPNNYSRE